MKSEKLPGRNQARKVAHSVAKPENSVDESFEDLLSKYKQIQLELEVIRKEESMALEPNGPPEVNQALNDRGSITETKAASEIPAASEETAEMKKAFQAFNIKPLRQKLPTPANLDKSVEEEEEGE